MQRRLGRYVIESEVGKGGMGVVYRARDERLGKTVALKILSNTGANTSVDQARLRREARAAAIMNHPSIVAVYDYDEVDGQPFIIYEYVEGKTLDRLIAAGPVTESVIVDIASQVASALAYAHERGIVHRDIKPQNIILTPEGRAKLLDYGLAKQCQIRIKSGDGEITQDLASDTEAGTIVGTAQYMSPEQICGEPLDGRSDIFSLGIVMYELICGSNPFLGQNLASTIGRIVSTTPLPAMTTRTAVSPRLLEIVERCLQKKREERYPSASSVLRDLQRLAEPSTPVGDKEADRGGQAPLALIPAALARALLILLQILYLSMYAFALVYYFDVLQKLFEYVVHYTGRDNAHAIAITKALTFLLLVSGCCGIPVRLYLMASVGFNDPATGRQFARIFVWLFLLDELWALSPFLLAGRWPAGITLICAATLAYLPFSHRNLIRNAYRVS